MARRNISELNARLRIDGTLLRGDIVKATRVLRRQLTTQAQAINRVLARTLTFGSAAAFTAGIAGIAIGVRNARREIDQLAKDAARIGVATDEFQALALAAEEAGGSSEQVVTAFSRLQEATADAAAGNATLQESFNALGLDFNRLAELNPFEAALEAGDALRTLVDDPVRFTALGRDLFGEGFTRLAVLFRGGLREGVSGARTFQRESGLTISPEQAVASQAFNDALGRLGSQFSGLAQQIEGEITPALTDIIQKLVDDFPVLNEALQPFIEGIGDIFTGLRLSVYELENAFEEAAWRIEGAFKFLEGAAWVSSLLFGGGAVAGGTRAASAHFGSKTLQKMAKNEADLVKKWSDEISELKLRKSQIPTKSPVQREIDRVIEIREKSEEAFIGNIASFEKKARDRDVDALDKLWSAAKNAGMSLLTGIAAERTGSLGDAAGEAAMQMREARRHDLKDWVLEINKTQEEKLLENEEMLAPLRKWIGAGGVSYPELTEHIPQPDVAPKPTAQQPYDVSQIAPPSPTQDSIAFEERVGSELKAAMERMKDSRRLILPFENLERQLEELAKQAQATGFEFPEIARAIEKIEPARIREMNIELDNAAKSLNPFHDGLTDIQEDIDKIRASEIGDAVALQLDRVQDLINATKAGVFDVFNALQANVGSAIDNLIETGRGNFRDFFASVLKDMAKIYARLALFGQSGAGGLLGSIAFSVFGSVFGAAVMGPAVGGFGGAGTATSIPGDANAFGNTVDGVTTISNNPELLPGFAAGGIMKQGNPAIVGERGAEIVIPKTDTRVIPHHTIMQAANRSEDYMTYTPETTTNIEKKSVVVNQHIAAGVNQAELQFAMEKAKQEMKQELLDDLGGAGPAYLAIEKITA